MVKLGLLKRLAIIVGNPCTINGCRRASTCAIDMNDQIQCMGGYNAHNWGWSGHCIVPSARTACGITSVCDECVIPR